MYQYLLKQASFFKVVFCRSAHMKSLLHTVLTSAQFIPLISKATIF